MTTKKQDKIEEIVRMISEHGEMNQLQVDQCVGLINEWFLSCVPKKKYRIGQDSSYNRDYEDGYNDFRNQLMSNLDSKD